jgi:hypothetical protein
MKQRQMPDILFIECSSAEYIAGASFAKLMLQSAGTFFQFPAPTRLFYFLLNVQE